MTRPPAQHWTSVDKLRPDLAILDQAATVAADLDEMWTSIPDRIALMFRHMEGQPSAADMQPGSSSTPTWCERHERDLRECPADELCTGYPYQPGTDPTGEAATNHDRAAIARTQLLRLIRHRIVLDRRIITILAAWPATPTRSSTTGDGGGLCRSCQRDRGYEKLVDRRPTDDGTIGAPYYAHSCRWCGDFRAVHNVDPPVELLRIRHEGIRKVTARDVTDALARINPKRKRR